MLLKRTMFSGWLFILSLALLLPFTSQRSHRSSRNRRPHFDVRESSRYSQSERDLYLTEQDSAECEDCNCPQTPKCSPGVSVVQDGCGCCKICARQLGEQCDPRRVCDYHKGLFCDISTGSCKASPGRPCQIQGKWYQNGDLFQLNCRATCSCINGDLGCVPTCNTPKSPPPMLSCRRPRLIRRKGKCCGEWICPKGGKLGKNVLRFDNEFKARPDMELTFREDSCMIQTTDWSPCSRTCGFGVSDRVTSDNKECKLTKQTRLCNLRPCTMNATTVTSTKRPCRKNIKQHKRIRFSMNGCLSTANYRPKYCGFCREKCCKPKASKTISVEFTCQESNNSTSTFTRDMMWIKKCSCDNDCFHNNDVFAVGYGTGLDGDVARLK